MLHNDPRLSTPGDNSGEPVAPDYHVELIACLEAAARARDAAIASIDRLTNIGKLTGCDPVRLRQAAGVL